MDVVYWSDLHHNFLGDGKGDLAVVENVNAALTSVINILRTARGERVMRRSFGSNVKGLLFEVMDEDLRSIYTRRIIEEVKRWENRVSFQAIDYKSYPDKGLVKIAFRFTIKGYADVFMQTITI